MMEAGVAESKGKRPYMEDRHIIATKLPTFPAFSLFGVFDGHGGSNASETLKELIIPTVETHIHQDKLLSISDTEARAEAMKTILHKSILEVDTLFGSIYPTRGRTGSTALVAMVWVGKAPILAVANVGDSRALLVKDDGYEALSQDHKPNSAREKERIEGLGGKVIQEAGSVARVQGILAVSRAVGDVSLRPYVIPDPEISITTLEPSHKAIVMGSDGVWDVLQNGECAKQVRKGLETMREPAKVAQELMREVQARGSVDNVTSVVITLNWQELIGKAQS